MSTIPPSNIASSVAQGALQQSQIARIQDARRNEAARHSQRMRELLRKHLESVEDSYETTDEHLVVDEEARNGGQQPGYELKDEQGEKSEQSAPQSPPVPSGDDPNHIPPRLDLTA